MLEVISTGSTNLNLVFLELLLNFDSSRRAWGRNWVMFEDFLRPVPTAIRNPGIRERAPQEQPGTGLGGRKVLLNIHPHEGVARNQFHRAQPHFRDEEIEAQSKRACILPKSHR